MFPLFTSTILLLAMTALAACTAAFTAVRGPPVLWRAALLVAAGALWALPLAAILGPDPYTINAATLAGAWTSGALLAGLFWGVLARRVAGFLPVVLVALFPWLTVSAYLLERQRVPQAPCASEVVFRIGDLDLTLPRRFGLRSERAKGAPVQNWEGAYSDWPGAKPHVRALCWATDGGTRPIEVSHIWLRFNPYRRELEAVCESGAALSSRPHVCEAVARVQPTIVQFYANPQGMTLPSFGQFNSDSIIQARANGNLEGYRCKDSARGPEKRHCVIWQELTPNVFAVSSAWAGPHQGGEDLLADSAILMEELRLRISAE